jgi:RNA polymerase sigma factor (sigma-70 family)
MNSGTPEPQITALYRNESRRVLATLIRLLHGNFDLAEDALQDAFIAALSQWQRDGIPSNPRAWLVSTGRHKAIDRLRKHARMNSYLEELAQTQGIETQTQPLEDDDTIEDDRLRLIFTCCHPSLALDARVALSLREVCGLTTEAIAAAFLVPVPTLAQRIVRAKNKIRDAGIPYEVPEPGALPQRLDAVLPVIYLVFNEAYSASSGPQVNQWDLSAEAIRLGRLLQDLLPDAEVWARDIQGDYGEFGINWGYASSPLLRGDALYVQVLHGMKTDDPSYVLKIDRMTGETIWHVERLTDAIRESPDSYSTPTWIEANGRAELIITGGDVVSGHDPETGREYWRADVLNPTNNASYRIVASPIAVGGLVIAPTRNNPMVAVRPGGSGDVADSHIVWSFAQGPDVPTPVTDGELLYIVRDNGVVFALDVQTGETVYGPVRLPAGTYSASPILADGKIYVTTEEEGTTTVFRAGREFEILSSNSLLGDCSPYCLSTIAVSEGQIFMRTASFLWAIGERRPAGQGE